MGGQVKAPEWLAVNASLAHFGSTRGTARTQYRRFVMDGVGAGSIWLNLRGQIYLGDEQFVERMQGMLGKDVDRVNVPRLQRRPPPPTLACISAQYGDRDAAIRAAYETGGYGYQEIAEHFGVHFTTLGRVVRAKRRTRDSRGRP